jgi:ribosomal-protein-alanine N-acetyltransferase
MGNDTTERWHLPDPGDESERAKAEALARIFNEVHTQRLILRRLHADDGPAMFAIHGDPATNLHNPFGPHADLAESEEMLRSCLDHWEGFGFGIWAVTFPHEEHVIGFGGIEHLIWRQRDILNLYYRFTPATWGNGYATELARTAVALAQEHLSQLPVVARTRAGNIASIRTAERAGLLRRPDLDTEHIVLALGWDHAC